MKDLFKNYAANSNNLKWANMIKREENADKYRLYGDLIMANLYNNKDFSPSISVYDYENNKNIDIELDSTKTLKENAKHRYFFRLKMIIFVQELNMLHMLNLLVIQ